MMIFVIVVALILLIAFVSVRWPAAGTLGVYAALLPFDAVLVAGMVGPIHLHLVWFVGLFAGIVLLLVGLTSRGFVRPPRTAAFWAGFSLLALVSSAWAASAPESLFRLPVVALLLVLYLIAASSRITEPELATITWLAILGACAASAMALYQFQAGTIWSPDAEAMLDMIDGAGFARRVSLALSNRITNPNDLAASLILPLSLAIGLWLGTRSATRRLLLIGVVALLGTTILLTMSRGAWVALTVVAMVDVWRTKANWRMVMPFALVSAVVAAMPEVFLTRFENATADRGAGRLDIWNTGLHVFKDHPVWGVGLDGFPSAADSYRYLAIHDWGPVTKSPHNIFLGAGVELGSVGLLLLLMAFLLHFRESSRAIRFANGPKRAQLISMEAGCWGLLAAGVFTHLLWEPFFWFSWLLLSVAVQAMAEHVVRAPVSRELIPARAGPTPWGALARRSN